MKEISKELSFIEIDGVKVPMIYERSEILPIVSLKLVVKSSGYIRDGEKFGLSHLCAKMLEEGTKKLGAVKFAEALDDKAISLSVINGIETLSFSLSSLKENFKYGVKMLKNLLNDPNFTNETLKKVKTVTLGQISAKKSDYDYVAYNELQTILYKDTPLENSNIGYEDSVGAMELKDVKSFYKKHLDLENCMVVIGGDLSENQAISYAKDLLKDRIKGEKREIQHIKTSEDMKIKEIEKQTEQAYVYFGSPFYMQSGDENLYKAKVLAFILGSSGFGSRLMEEIRVKRGLAYSAYGKIRVEHSHSVFTGYLQTKNENKDEAIKIVKEVVSEFIDSGVSEDELTQAKRFLLGSEPLRNETLSQRLGKTYAEVYRDLGLGYFDKELELIEGLGLEDLNAFIKSHDEIKKMSFCVVRDEDKPKR